MLIFVMSISECWNLLRGRMLFNKAEATRIQCNLIQKRRSDSSWVYVPTSWKGSDPHTIVLGFRMNETGTINVVKLNTGDGIGSHSHAKDPSEIYPLLTQLWIEFENIIPLSVLFDEKAWFIRSWIFIGISYFTQYIEQNSSMSDIFMVQVGKSS